jgi:hypothetical protein
MPSPGRSSRKRSAMGTPSRLRGWPRRCLGHRMAPSCALEQASACRWRCSWVAVGGQAQGSLREARQARPLEERRGTSAKGVPALRRLGHRERPGLLPAAPRQEAHRARHARTSHPRPGARAHCPAQGWALLPLSAVGARIDGRSAASPRFARVGLGPSCSRPHTARRRSHCQ